MYSRVTLLEVDALRMDVDAAVALFRDEVLPLLREEPGFEGAAVLATPEGKGMIITTWESAEAAVVSADLAAGELERRLTLFKAPPGREYYEVAFLELPEVVR